MLPKTYLQKFASAVVKRSGICKATVEAVLPHIFDEIRYQLTEGNQCVPIESFGTFAVVDIPERRYNYTYKEPHRTIIVPAKKRLKFAPTRNLQREVDEEQFDPSRSSFSRHPEDKPIRRRKDMQYRPMKGGMYIEAQSKENKE